MIFNEDTLTKYNKAINEYRNRIRRNDMGGCIDLEDIPFGYISDEKLPCGCRKPWAVPNIQCVLNKPLMMVIPPDGAHLSCPAHAEGHHVFGSQVTY